MLLLGMEMLLQHSASIGYEDRIVCWMKWVKKSKMYGDGMAYLNIWKYIFSYGIIQYFYLLVDVVKGTGIAVR